MAATVAEDSRAASLRGSLRPLLNRGASSPSPCSSRHGARSGYGVGRQHVVGHARCRRGDRCSRASTATPAVCASFPLLHFVWLVVVDLVVSTVNVAWEILTPTDYTDEAIIAVDTNIEARSHFLMLVVAITVTPGTAVIDSDADTGRLYLHLLHAEKAPEIELHVRHLAELACRALPVNEEAAS